ncbi:MAG: metallophosphoesterase [Terriglobales bacterium]
MRTRIAVFIIIVQSILFLTHWFIYETWMGFRPVVDPPGITGLQAALALSSVSFIAASLLAHRYFNILVRFLYSMAAFWLGMVNFLFLAACLCWIIYFAARFSGVHLDRPEVAAVLFGLAIIVSLYSFIGARWVRVKRISIRLPNLPPTWRGRVAALVSDVHLGHVNGVGFMRRIVAKLGRLQPDILFLTGDLYDGTKVDPAPLAAPWKGLSPALGAYFVTGNHEEFSDPSKYLDAVRESGIRVLNGEKVTIDGLQLVGVHHHHSTNANRFRSVLEHVGLHRGEPSILLSHVPHALSIAEECGVSLQLSGHTHGGQFFPFTWFTRRIFGEYTYGLKRFGKMMVYTTTGVGTWGPPMRLGAPPEIVLIEFA